MKILGVFPVPAPSHYILGSALMRGLAEKGHDVTVLNTFGEKDIPKTWKYRDIILEGFKEEREKRQMNLLDFQDFNPFMTLMFMNFIGNDISEKTLAHPNTQKLLHSGEKFDIVIIEQFVNDALKVFAYKFNASLVMLSTVGANAWVNPLVANPAPPSYVPELLLSFGAKMSFKERMINSVMYVAGMINRHLLFFPSQNRIMKAHIPDAPDLSVLLYNVSLILLNSHPSANQPVPHVPNMIEIGGFHMKPSKALPKDLQEFLDNAKNGVVYFSMGSNLKSKDLPTDKREAILKALSKLKQQVIWKWEDDVLPGQPPNVKLGKWFPQQSILAHPNVKAFITHGGLLSTTETLYCGVPILTIPIFGDQEVNAANAVVNGYGVKVNYKQLNEETFSNALSEVLNNPKYAENAKRRSKVLHDRLVKPLDEAVFWIEYVARHNGAPHLRSAALDLAWYQYILLDVILVLSLAVLGVILALRAFCRLCCLKRKCNSQEKFKKQ